jgi:hypothetical protein
MSILAQSESRGSARCKLEEIALVLRAVRSVSRRCLELTIQGSAQSLGGGWPSRPSYGVGAVALPALRDR